MKVVATLLLAGLVMVYSKAPAHQRVTCEQVRSFAGHLSGEERRKLAKSLGLTKRERIRARRCLRGV